MRLRKIKLAIRRRWSAYLLNRAERSLFRAIREIDNWAIVSPQASALYRGAEAFNGYMGRAR